MQYMYCRNLFGFIGIAMHQLRDGNVSTEYRFGFLPLVLGGFILRQPGPYSSN